MCRLIWRLSDAPCGRQSVGSLSASPSAWARPLRVSSGACPLHCPVGARQPVHRGPVRLSVGGPIRWPMTGRRARLPRFVGGGANKVFTKIDRRKKVRSGKRGRAIENVQLFQVGTPPVAVLRVSACSVALLCAHFRGPASSPPPPPPLPPPPRIAAACSSACHLPWQSLRAACR